MIPIQTDWEGRYSDGRTAASQSVLIRLMRLGLHVTTENGETLWWPYEEIRQTQGFYSGEQVRLERGGEFAEVLLISDAKFLTHLHQIAQEQAAKFHDPARRRMRPSLILLSALASVGIMTALYIWGIPALAAIVAPGVPVAWEERLGQSVVENMVSKESRCVDPSRMDVINEILKTMTAPLPKSPYTIHVIVADDPMVNAFAAPGGYIVILRGLIERSQSAEELAGVLAHELQHIFQHDVTRMLIQQVSTGLLLVAFTGDASGISAYGFEAARILGTLQYNRVIEEEADAAGMRMLLDARINPKGMISFFQGLGVSDIGTPSVLKYLSTHPNTTDRILRLKMLALRAKTKPIKLLKDYDWNDMKKICATEG